MAKQERPFSTLRTDQLKALAVSKPELIPKIIEELKHHHRSAAIRLLKELTAGQHVGTSSPAMHDPRADVPALRPPFGGQATVEQQTPKIQPLLVLPLSQPKLFPDMEPGQANLFSGISPRDAHRSSAVSQGVVSLHVDIHQEESTPRELWADADTTDEVREDLLGTPLPHVLPANIPPIKPAEQIGGDDPTMNPGADTVIDRTLRLFRFLVDLENLRQDPVRDFGKHPWRLPLLEVPLHSKTRVGTVPSVAEEGIILEVENPERHSRPKPPASISGWLSSPLDNPKHPPEVNQELPGSPPQRFGEEPARLAAWNSFRAEWKVWAEKELVDRPVRDIYQQLIALRDLLAGNTDTLQLMIADGLLAWDSPAGPIRHPLLGRRVDISFDSLDWGGFKPPASAGSL